MRRVVSGLFVTQVVGGVVNKETGGDQPAIAKSVQDTVLFFPLLFHLNKLAKRAQAFDACIIGRGVQQNAPLLEAVKGVFLLLATRYCADVLLPALVLQGKNSSVQLIFPPGPHNIAKQLEAAFWSRPGLVSFMLLKVIIGTPVKVCNSYGPPSTRLGWEGRFRRSHCLPYRRGRI
jgi:hypothetical protein